MSDLGKAFENFTNALIRTEQQTHASVVLRGVSIIDYDLERCLIASMVHLSNKLRGRLFINYGPLSTLAGKIDIAYAFGLFDKSIYEELLKIKKIRNAFAHRKELLSLKSTEINTLFKELKKPRGVEGTYLQVFVACVEAIDDVLEAYLVSKGVVDDIRAKNLSGTGGRPTSVARK